MKNNKNYLQYLQRINDYKSDSKRNHRIHTDFNLSYPETDDYKRDQSQFQYQNGNHKLKNIQIKLVKKTSFIKQINQSNDSLPKGVTRRINEPQTEYEQRKKNSSLMNGKATRYLTDNLQNIKKVDQLDKNEISFKESPFQAIKQKIKQPVQYSQKADTFILKQKQLLINMIKALNTKINQQIIKQQPQLDNKVNPRNRIKTEMDEHETKRQNTRKQRLLTQNKNQQPNFNEQANANNKLIMNMQSQLKYLLKKLDDYKLSLIHSPEVQKQILIMMEKIKKTKDEISKIRKKKFLSEKQFMQHDKRNGNLLSVSKDIVNVDLTGNKRQDKHNYVLLKQQLTEMNKKKQSLKYKIQAVIKQTQKIEDLKQKNQTDSKYIELINKNDNSLDQSIIHQALETSNYQLSPQKKDHIPFQQLQIMLKRRLSKLEIIKKSIKRQNQSNKHKYYLLLKQLQKINDTQNIQSKEIEYKIMKSKQQIQFLLKRLKRSQQMGKIKRNNPQNITNSIHSNINNHHSINHYHTQINVQDDLNYQNLYDQYQYDDFLNQQVQSKKQQSQSNTENPVSNTENPVFITQQMNYKSLNKSNEQKAIKSYKKVGKIKSNLKKRQNLMQKQIISIKSSQKKSPLSYYSNDIPIQQQIQPQQTSGNDNNYDILSDMKYNDMKSNESKKQQETKHFFNQSSASNQQIILKQTSSQTEENILDQEFQKLVLEQKQQILKIKFGNKLYINSFIR